MISMTGFLSHLVRTSIALLLALPMGLSAPVWAAPEDGEVGRTPPRLSLLEGDVSFWRPGTEDWVRARLNMALAPGDALYTGNGARVEMQIGGRAFVRLAGDTQLGVENQEPDFVHFKVSSGLATLDLRELAQGHTVEIDAPNAAFIVEEPGYYRLDIGQERTTFATRRGGRARVKFAGGQATDIGSNDQVTVEGVDAPRLAADNAPALDDWDRWNYDRTDRVLAAASSRYLPREVYGAEALDAYGTWRVVPTYGRVWVPTYVPPAWAPYSTGEWVWDAYYGWTWVDYAPWGWAPYHYGRWVHLHSYWAWAPGPIVVAPVYAPALVAFFGGGGVHVSVGVPFVSWVALGWGEPLVPWWGHRGFIGVPCWRGWGGPRIVNNVVVHHTTIINQPTTFVNTRVRDAVVGVRRDRFGLDATGHVRLAQADASRLRPLGGEVPVRPALAAGRTQPPARTVRGLDASRARGAQDTQAVGGGQGSAGAERQVAPRPAERGMGQPPPSSERRSGWKERRQPPAAPSQGAPPVSRGPQGERRSVSEAGRRQPPQPNGGASGERTDSEMSEMKEPRRPPAPQRSGGEQRWTTRSESSRPPNPPPRRYQAPATRERAVERERAPEAWSPPERPRRQAPSRREEPQPRGAPPPPQARPETVAPERPVVRRAEPERFHAPRPERIGEAPPPGVAPRVSSDAPAPAPEHPAAGEAPAGRGRSLRRR